ncbi:MAG: NAD(P)-dependent dehydrogenase (short-subunit alcohol dehydrogenase family) [Halieaceae bacterium]|jgi:NAD(P)-dependent dehydrogenase (short-subunit alcohol dehydrogenase family)
MKTIFITGAAHGLGLATAKHFASQGWYVGLYDINREALESVLSSGDFPNACGLYCDVTKRASIDEALKHFALHTDGKLHVLVNNAGVLASGKFEEIDPSFHERIIDINVKGLTQVAHSAFSLLQQTPGATLVNLCSVSSVYGLPLLAVYSASKFYVNGLTEALSIEWAEHDIRVTSVKPPLVNTAMGHQVDPRITQKLAMDMEPEYVAQAIQTAVEGNRIGYVLGTSARLWALLDKFLPESGRRRLVRYLTSY